MKKKKYKSTESLAKDLGLPRNSGQLADLKAKLTKHIINTVEKNELTHQEVSDLSGVPRSAITGIINGSLQKVTLDRLARILISLGLLVDLKIKKVA